MEQIRITVPGIKKSLKNYDFKKSLAEYIWNGFDAGATCVSIHHDNNGLGGIDYLSVEDNGIGINFHSLRNTFTPFFESQKDLDVKVRSKFSSIRGKNGVGRLTFFKFSRLARWNTVFENGNSVRQQYTITVESDTLDTFQSSEPEPSLLNTGTKVEFWDLFDSTIFQFEDEVIPYLKKEFGWFLALNQPRDFALLINNEPLDYGDLIADQENFQILVEDKEFLIRYIRWSISLNKEYSRFYFIGSDLKERYKETTTLNNKGDTFYHSLFVTSDYFDSLQIPDFTAILESEANDQLPLFGLDRSEKISKELIVYLNEYLYQKRVPFLRSAAARLIENFERDGVFPAYKNNPWDLARHNQLEAFVRGLYEIEPRIFQELNIEQKKTFTHMLNLIMEDGEREHLLEILKEVINLSTEDMKMLAEILKKSRLSGIIKTIRMIEDRYQAIEQLKALVFRKELGADEPHHIQKMIESHYWLFGEQYHLVTAAEQKFEEAMHRYVHLLRGEKSDRKIDHPDRLKEMDIFMVRQLMIDEHTVSNIVLELKNPSVKLGSLQLEQVKKYMHVILEQPEFNAPNMKWDFFLIGNEFDTTGYIKAELENSRSHGERSLVFRLNQYRIYVKTWSEIFTDFELRHKFLIDRLKLERDKISVVEQNANDVIASQRYNSAVQPQVFLASGN